MTDLGAAAPPELFFSQDTPTDNGCMLNSQILVLGQEYLPVCNGRDAFQVDMLFKLLLTLRCIGIESEGSGGRVMLSMRPC